MRKKRAIVSVLLVTACDAPHLASCFVEIDKHTPDVTLDGVDAEKKARSSQLRLYPGVSHW